MEKDDFGVWEITMPPNTIEHGTRVKLRMETFEGQWIERTPAWIKWAMAEPVRGRGASRFMFPMPPDMSATGSSLAVFTEAMDLWVCRV
eukprot:scaffold3713_cov372-Prasinococcus_capsulatus_cf.AAC.6